MIQIYIELATLPIWYISGWKTRNLTLTLSSGSTLIIDVTCHWKTQRQKSQLLAQVQSTIDSVLHDLLIYVINVWIKTDTPLMNNQIFGNDKRSIVDMKYVANVRHVLLYVELWTSHCWRTTSKKHYFFKQLIWNHPLCLKLSFQTQ